MEEHPMKKQFMRLIPSPLNYIENKLIQSVLPYSSMQFTDRIYHPTQSKIAGKPFLPPKSKLPLTESGDKMFLVIQINFAEVALPIPFPTKGIFQLFIDPTIINSKKIGFNHLTKNYYEIRYFQEQAFFQNEIFEIQSSPTTSAIQKELGIRFLRRYEPVSFTDYRLQTFVNSNDIQLFEQQTDYPFEEIYTQHFLSAENKIGGYPYFLNEDIRLKDLTLRFYDTLICQIVSNEDDHIMFGNCGVLKLFINKLDLSRKVFSDLLLIVEDYT